MIKERLKKGIYFIPTMLTMGNILCGFFAIVASINQQWLFAGTAIGIAFFLDGLDGRVARLTDTETDFGLQLDSQADLVTFGAAPAVLAYTKWLYPYERLGILLCFLYVCGAAMRLARYNAHDVKENSLDYFNGFPTPAAAGVVVSFYFIEYKYFLQLGEIHARFYQVFQLAIPFVLLVLSYLMLSNIRYPTFKKVTWTDIHPFGIMFALVCLVFVSAQFPLVTYSLFFLGYLATGFLDLRRLVQRLLASGPLGADDV